MQMASEELSPVPINPTPLDPAPAKSAAAVPQWVQNCVYNATPGSAVCQPPWLQRPPADAHPLALQHSQSGRTTPPLGAAAAAPSPCMETGVTPEPAPEQRSGSPTAPQPSPYSPTQLRRTLAKGGAAAFEAASDDDEGLLESTSAPLPIASAGSLRAAAGVHGSASAFDGAQESEPVRGRCEYLPDLAAETALPVP